VQTVFPERYGGSTEPSLLIEREIGGWDAFYKVTSPGQGSSPQHLAFLFCTPFDIDCVPDIARTGTAILLLQKHARVLILAGYRGEVEPGRGRGSNGHM